MHLLVCLAEETFDRQKVMVPENYIQVPLIIYHLDACDWLNFTVIPMTITAKNTWSLLE